MVIEFKRDVYQMALTELSRFLPRGIHHNRYLRAGMRVQPRRDEGEPLGDDDAGSGAVDTDRSAGPDDAT